MTRHSHRIINIRLIFISSSKTFAARLDTGKNVKKLWKYARSYQDSLINPPDTPSGVEQFELYDLYTDPIEANNLGWDNVGATAEAQLALDQMKDLLAKLRSTKAKHPKNLNVS